MHIGRAQADPHKPLTQGWEGQSWLCLCGAGWAANHQHFRGPASAPAEGGVRQHRERSRLRLTMPLQAVI